MKSSSGQAAKIMQEKKGNRRLFVIVLCLAVLVVAAVAVILHLRGEAMNHTRRVLDCSFVHVHTEECFSSEGTLTCGLADYAVHKHNDDCYENGALVCPLPEIEEHTHDESCYSLQNVLTCGLAESEPHTHGEGCYETVRSLTCGLEESAAHAHTESCYDEDGALVCGLEESAGHTHSDACYSESSTLTCTLPEGEGHTHDESCYAETSVLSCGKPEVVLHTHTDECYETVFDPETGEEKKTDKLMCGLLQVEEHTHGELCFRIEELTPEEVAALGGEGTEIVDLQLSYEDAHLRVRADYDTTAELPEEVALTLVETGEEELVRPAFMAQEKEYTPASTVLYTVQYLDENGAELGAPQTYAYTPGEEQPTFARLLRGSVKICRTEQFEVTASYTDLAGIPKEAELRARLVTDEELIAQYETEYRAAMHSEEAQMQRLMDIGFWLGEEEIQPAAPVTITVQFLDGDGLPVGEKITVVHFAQEGAEVQRAQVNESGAASFDMSSFSMVGLGHAPSADEMGRVRVDHVFTWQDENGLYTVSFRVQGILAPQREQTGEEPEQTGEEPIADAPLADPDLMEFSVETLAGEDEEYQTFAQFSEQNGSSINLSVLRYAMRYDGVPMDLSACLVEATVTPTAELEAAAQLYSEQQPIDNGDDDGDGYVDAPGSSGGLLPAPEVDRGLLLSVLVPTQDEEAPVAVEDSVVVGSAQAASADADGAAVLDVLNGASAAQETPGEEILTPAAANGTPQDGNDPAATLALNSEEGIMALDVALQLNPTFKVEYYAEMEQVVRSETSGANSLPLIDTSKNGDGKGGNLPQNGGSSNPPALFPVESPNGAKLTYLELENGLVKMQKKQVEVFQSQQYEYYKAPSLPYFDLATGSRNYRIKSVEVRQAGSTETTVYTGEALNNLHFTNNSANIPQGVEGTYVTITSPTQTDQTTIRLIYEPIKPSELSEVSANFYDYDISGGVYENGRLLTGEKGINSGLDKTMARFGFGNLNTGTGTGADVWKDGEGLQNRLNGRNRNAGWSSSNTDVSYGGCTFGLVSGITDGEDPTVVFSDGISAPPNLFKSKTGTTGKRSFDGSLHFQQVGDTYTLNLATVDGGGSASNLQRITHPYKGNQQQSVWTNNFWPMDGVTKLPKNNQAKDPMFGEIGGSVIRFKGFQETIWGLNGVGQVDYCKDGLGDFPESDDGKAHNSYFGMRYQVKFTLDKDYIGPLEYYFFGDDDMWVFLDGKLVCDIGGVHPSVGEYVDLWDYLVKGQEGEHTLSVFYTERGASGSTCWMQFTLPSVTTVENPVEDSDYGDLMISKTVEKSVNGEPHEPFDNGETFTFRLDLKEAGGSYLHNNYSYTKYRVNEDGKAEEIGYDLIIYTGVEFTLKHNEYIVIKHLPDGATYTVTETLDSGGIKNAQGKNGSRYEYTAAVSVNGGEETAGTRVTEGGVEKIEIKGSIAKQHTGTVDFVNRYETYALPETGGPGTGIYLLCGGALTLSATGLLVYTRRKKARR